MYGSVIGGIYLMRMEIYFILITLIFTVRVILKAAYSASASQMQQWSANGTIGFQVRPSGFNSYNNYYCSADDYFGVSCLALIELISLNTASNSEIGYYDLHILDQSYNKW